MTLMLSGTQTLQKNADYLLNSLSRSLPSFLSRKAIYGIYKKELGDKPNFNKIALHIK